MKRGRPPKTLAELLEPPSTFRFDRHRDLLRDDLELTAEEIELVLERDRAGFAKWQTAAALRVTVGIVTNALRLHRPTCECHGEPMFWHKNDEKLAGGLWRCSAKHRDVSRAAMRRMRERRAASAG